LGALVHKDVALLADLGEQRGVLRERAERLRGVLESCGWKVLPPQGGLFLVASPRAYMGKSISVTKPGGERFDVKLDASTLPEALLACEDVLVNGDMWTGLPGFCRFVLSTRSETFERGLAGLRRFHARVVDPS
jgi:methionine S-methyltransferase